MATRRKKSRRDYDDSADDYRPRRGGRKLVLFFLLLLLLAWAAPIIVGRTPLVNVALKRAAPINGSITVGYASLGWFSPINASDVLMTGSDGKPIVKAVSLTCDRSLLGLLLSPSDLGNVRIVSPNVNLITRAGGSNLEDALAPLLEQSSPSSGVQGRFEIFEGTLQLSDVRGGQSAQLEQIALKLGMTRASALPQQLDLNARMRSGTDVSDVRVAIETTQQGSSLAGKLNANIDRLALAALEPLARRVLPEAQLAGQVSTQITAAWQDNGQQFTADGNTSISQFSLGAAALGRDRIQLASIQAPLHIERKADRITCRDTSIKSDLAQLNISGTALVKDLASTDWVAWMRGAEFKSTGQVDLAALARMLPETLHLQNTVTIDSGSLAMNVASTPDPQGTRWSAQVDTTSLTGRAQGRAIRWEKPVTMSVSAHDTSHGPILDAASCKADFLSIHATGTPDQLKATGNFDLVRLMSQLKQFADFGATDLAGAGTFEVGWKRSPDGEVRGGGTLGVRNFSWTRAGQPPWREPELTVAVETRGMVRDLKLTRIETGTLAIRSGQEELAARLLAPIADPARGTWPFEATWRGRLESWLPRLASLADVSKYELGGAGQLSGTGSYSASHVEIHNLRAAIDSLHARTPEVLVDEPRAELTAAGARWTAEQGIKLSSASVVVGASSLQIQDAGMSASGLQNATGTATYNADLSQVGRWLSPGATKSLQLSGKLSGQTQLTTREKIAAAKTENSVTDFVATYLPTKAQGAGGTATTPTSWREPKMNLAGRGQYDTSNGGVVIEQAELTSNAVRCALAGNVRRQTDAYVADVSGKLDYDLEKLGPVWQAYLGPSARIAGRQSRDFYVRGPLPTGPQSSWQDLAAQGAFGWESAQLFGLQVGPGEVAGKLAAGILQIDPLDVKVNEGRVALAPQVRFAPAPAEIRLARGPAVQQLRLTPELCANYLKFVTPLLAEATVAEGQFSIDLEGGQLPVADPAAGQVAGHFKVQSAQVKPGPLAQTFISIGKQIEALVKRRPAAALDADPRALITMQGQDVEFRMVNRRMYHRKITFTAGELPISTYGSVGFDESLLVMAEVPILESWVGGDPALSSLKGQVLQLPISGTLQRPQIDRKALETLTSQLVQNTARGLLFDQLNKTIDKLVPIQPKR